ncbi:hypothetical protein K438DRAFT_1775364 [Mycena galopus ATCC 62051]|nr:hypothetical protein K438DRAFT_1775364 [Mycena galopus ATCC 62051]
MIPVPDLTRSPLFFLALVVAGSGPELEALDVSEPPVGVGWVVVDVVNPEVTAPVAGDAEAEVEPGEPGFEPVEFPAGDTDPSLPMVTWIEKPFAAQRCCTKIMGGRYLTVGRALDILKGDALGKQTARPRRTNQTVEEGSRDPTLAIDVTLRIFATVQERPYQLEYIKERLLRCHQDGNGCSENDGKCYARYSNCLRAWLRRKNLQMLQQIKLPAGGRRQRKAVFKALPTPQALAAKPQLWFLGLKPSQEHHCRPTRSTLVLTGPHMNHLRNKNGGWRKDVFGGIARRFSVDEGNRWETHWARGCSGKEPRAYETSTSAATSTPSGNQRIYGGAPSFPRVAVWCWFGVRSKRYGSGPSVRAIIYSSELSECAAQHLPHLVADSFDPNAPDLDEAIVKIFEVFDQSPVSRFPRRGLIEQLVRAEPEFREGRLAVVGTTVLISIIEKEKSKIWVVSLGDPHAGEEKIVQNGRVPGLLAVTRGTSQPRENNLFADWHSQALGGHQLKDFRNDHMTPPYSSLSSSTISYLVTY